MKLIHIIKRFVPVLHIKTNQAAINIIVNAMVAMIGMIGLATALAPAVAQVATGTGYVQTGVVTRVVDGDTVWVQTPGRSKPLKLRIDGIDAPEICQPGGVQAQTALKSRVIGQSVTVTSKAHDDYGRTVGALHVQGQDVARWMVANGHAWVYTFRSKKSPYSVEFARARIDRRCMFANTQAQEPRQFRKAHGACSPFVHRPTK